MLQAAKKVNSGWHCGFALELIEVCGKLMFDAFFHCFCVSNVSVCKGKGNKATETKISEPAASSLILLKLVLFKHILGWSLSTMNLYADEYMKE